MRLEKSKLPKKVKRGMLRKWQTKGPSIFHKVFLQIPGRGVPTPACRARRRHRRLLRVESHEQHSSRQLRSRVSP